MGGACCLPVYSRAPNQIAISMLISNYYIFDNPTDNCEDLHEPKDRIVTPVYQI